jgi:hypothetical protein
MAIMAATHRRMHDTASTSTVSWNEYALPFLPESNAEAR